MKVLLIYPPATVYGPGEISPHFPLGLAYLAAFIEKKGYQVKVLDTLALGKNTIKARGKSRRVGLSDEDIAEIVQDFKPDVVGVSVMFTAYASDALSIASLIKKVSPHTYTVFGGAHVSIDPKAIVKNRQVDFAVYGEGEITFSNLLEALKKGKSVSKLTGIAYRKGRKLIQNPPTPFIKDLDSLPYPARHLLPMDQYDTQKDPFTMRHPYTSIITSRGCPGVCVYCSIHSIWGHRWRGRSAKNVVDEIEYLIKEYGIKELRLQDDSASLNKKRMAEICNEIIKRKMDIKWTTPNGIAHWTLDKPLLRKMKKAGCYRITFGIESGNPEMRRWVGKPFSLEQAKELTKYANNLGFWTIATNIIGFPYETREQIEDTIKYAIDSDVDFALFFRLGPRPGTPVYEVFKKEGLLPKDERVLYSESVACSTKYIRGKDLFEIQNQAYSRFFRKRLINFLNPLRIIRKIHNLEDLNYVLGMAQAGLKMTLRLMTSKSAVTSRALKKL